MSKKLTHYPIFPLIKNKTEIIKELKKVAKKLNLPVQKLSYERELFYYEQEGIKDRGWTDGAEIIYTP